MAWAKLPRELGFEFTPAAGGATRGVSRMESLEIVLRSGGIADRFTAEERLRLAERKNARCLELLSRITPAEVLPGAA